MLMTAVISMLLGYPKSSEAVQVSNDRTVAICEAGQKTTDYMHARYYSPNLGRFVSVDPVGGDIGSSQSWNRYSYVLNNPMVLIDPTGEASFLVSRPLGFMSEKYAHLFIATHADDPGDPNATIVSYGQNDEWNMGRVDHNTTNDFSKDTHQSDIDAWNSLAEDNSDVATGQIDADDDVVLETANSLMENQDYSALTSVLGIPTGVNSNSAAVAVAEEASGVAVDVPGTREAPGADKSHKVQFDKNGDGKPDQRNYDKK
jgi:RHS repeat-associated protein